MNTVSLAAFIKRNWAPSRLWDGCALVPWVDWFVEDDRLAVVRRRGRLVGLGMCRLLGARGDHADSYAHDEGGSSVWIDLFISRDRHVGAILWDAMLARFGTRKELGFQRDERVVCAPRFHDFNQMERIMRYGK